MKNTEVTLRFRSNAEKDYFLGQLSDGWGENFVNLSWPWEDGVSLKDAEIIDVENFKDEDDEED